MGNDEMSISAFSRRSLLSIKALRLYDEMGLLTPSRIDPASRYRYYSEAQLETARFISLMRRLDVPLATIAKIVSQNPPGAAATLSDWWEHEQAEMARRADLLAYILTTIPNDSGVDSEPGYKIDVRSVPDTTWLYLSKHVHGPELPGFIGQANEYLQQRAEQYGGALDYMTLIIHGVIDLDSDGPADVCLPIAAGSVAQNVDLIRTESSHQQAFTVLRKYQMDFPQILRAYRALREWIDHNGYSISGPPREHYLGQFGNAGSHDEICVIAFPILPALGAKS